MTPVALGYTPKRWWHHSGSHDMSCEMLQMEMRLKSAEAKHNEDKLQLHKRHEMAMKQVQFGVSCYSTVTQPGTGSQEWRVGGLKSWLSSTTSEAWDCGQEKWEERYVIMFVDSGGWLAEGWSFRGTVRARVQAPEGAEGEATLGVEEL